MKARVPAALVLDADPATLALLREWLCDAGWAVVDPGMVQGGSTACDLVLVDLAFPRRGDAASIRRIAAAYPEVPLLALSATFHASVEPCGELARSLGVAGVLPKPIRREALMDTVRRLSGTGT